MGTAGLKERVAAISQLPGSCILGESECETYRNTAQVCMSVQEELGRSFLTVTPSIYHWLQVRKVKMEAQKARSPAGGSQRAEASWPPR